MKDGHRLKKMVLPRDSRDFVLSMEDVTDINPYLSQYRICYENPNEKRHSKEPYIPLIMYRIKQKKIYGDEFCKGELSRIAKTLNDQNRRLAGYFPEFKEYMFSPYDKMIIGESGSVYFNVQPLRLHPLYGLPFIPASTIKGTLRGTWIMEEGGTSEEFEKLFGSMEGKLENQRGKLVFFDCFPEQFSVGLDVQTPHYKNYYESGNSEPTDDQNPIPIQFVCLRDAKFNIRIACQDSGLWKNSRKKVDKMVDVMYRQFGIGAKSALGYGIT